MWEMLSYPFFQSALIAGTLSAAMCALVGVYVLLKRIVFVGITLAQLASLGVAMVLLVDVHPMIMALMTTLTGVACFALTRAGQRVPQEGVIGASYVMAAALGIICVAKNPVGEARNPEGAVRQHPVRSHRGDGGPRRAFGGAGHRTRGFLQGVPVRIFRPGNRPGSGNQRTRVGPSAVPHHRSGDRVFHSLNGGVARVCTTACSGHDGAPCGAQDDGSVYPGHWLWGDRGSPRPVSRRPHRPTHRHGGGRHVRGHAARRSGGARAVSQRWTLGGGGCGADAGI